MVEDALSGGYGTRKLAPRFKRSARWAQSVLDSFREQLKLDLNAAVGSLRQILDDVEADAGLRSEYEIRIQLWLNIGQATLAGVRDRAEEVAAAVPKLRKRVEDDANVKLRELLADGAVGLAVLEGELGRDRVDDALRDVDRYVEPGHQPLQQPLREALAHRLLTKGISEDDKRKADAEAFLGRLRRLTGMVMAAGAGPAPGGDMLPQSAGGAGSETVDTRPEPTGDVVGDAATDDTERVVDEPVMAEFFDPTELRDLRARLGRLGGHREPSGGPMPAGAGDSSLIADGGRPVLTAATVPPGMAAPVIEPTGGPGPSQTETPEATLKARKANENKGRTRNKEVRLEEMRELRRSLEDLKARQAELAGVPASLLRADPDELSVSDAARRREWESVLQADLAVLSESDKERRTEWEALQESIESAQAEHRRLEAKDRLRDRNAARVREYKKRKAAQRRVEALSAGGEVSFAGASAEAKAELSAFITDAEAGLQRMRDEGLKVLVGEVEFGVDGLIADMRAREVGVVSGGDDGLVNVVAYYM
ncbi:hypothetical protein, partial [Saccharopolyspora sp. NPDC050642]|uniref:hypothetical protein n=1 Tax=Saccharopolyspora sp. NPDC050642 TaxID=3157099 RepID=UPI0033CCD997